MDDPHEGGSQEQRNLGSIMEEDEREGTTQVWTNQNGQPVSNRKNLASRHSTGGVIYEND